MDGKVLTRAPPQQPRSRPVGRTRIDRPASRLPVSAGVRCSCRVTSLGSAIRRTFGERHVAGAAAQVPARRERDADPLVQRAARPADPTAAGAAPGHRAAGRAGRPGAAVPDGPDPAGGVDRAVRRHPGGGARRLPAVAAEPAVPRAPAGEGARHAGADLLQVRRRLAGRLAQAEHRGAAGVLQRQGRDQEAHHRDRRRPVGHGAGVRLRAVRPGVRGLAGAGVVRPEALPPDDDRDVRRHGAPQPLGPDRGRPHDPRRAPRLDRLARHRDQRGGRGRGAGPDHRTTRSAACSTTC